MTTWPQVTIRNRDLTETQTQARFEDYARTHWMTIAVYDLEPDPEPNKVTSADLGRMVFMNTRLSGDDAANLIRLGNSPDARWDQLPLDAQLSDANPDD